MRTLAALLAAMALCAQAMAQNLEDVIYLRDGGAVRGTLIEQVPSAKIRTSEGYIMTIEPGDIDHIAQEAANGAQGPTAAEASLMMRDDPALLNAQRARGARAQGSLSGGMRLLAGAAFQQRPSKYNCSALSVDVSIGKQVGPRLFAGGGICDEILFDYWYYGYLDEIPTPVAQMPVFAHVRFDACPLEKSPVAELRAGYSITADENVDYSGIYVNPCIGYRMGRITVSLGLELVRLNNEWCYSVLGAGGLMEDKTVRFQKSIQAKVTMEWGGRK